MMKRPTMAENIQKYSKRYLKARKKDKKRFLISSFDSPITTGAMHRFFSREGVLQYEEQKMVSVPVFSNMQATLFLQQRSRS